MKMLDRTKTYLTPTFNGKLLWKRYLFQRNEVR